MCFAGAIGDAAFADSGGSPRVVATQFSAAFGEGEQFARDASRRMLAAQTSEQFPLLKLIERHAILVLYEKQSVTTGESGIKRRRPAAELNQHTPDRSAGERVENFKKGILIFQLLVLVSIPDAREFLGGVACRFRVRFPCQDETSALRIVIGNRRI